MLAGAVSWFSYLGVMRWTNQVFWNPHFEPGTGPSVSVQLALTAIPVFAVWGVLVAALLRQRWWALWLAFVAGIVTSIAVRASFFADGFKLAIWVFQGAAFLTAVPVAAIAAYLTMRNRAH
jgi:hypothetical protein